MFLSIVRDLYYLYVVSMPINESTVSDAIQHLNEHPNESIRAVAKAYGLGESTLRRRVNGQTTTHAASHEQYQRLLPIQEEFLVDWIIEQDQQGFPPSHVRAREMAIRVLRLNNDFKPLGKRWIQKFIQRNLRIASIVGRPIEAARLNSTTREAIQSFYNLYQQLQSQHNFQAEEIWNMDEHGIALGVCTNSRVLASSSKKRTYKKSPETREWVSILEAINAAGQIINPLIIYKGKAPQTTWFTSNSPNWTYTASENGWTANSIAVNWLQKIFIPQIHQNHQRPQLLIMDGHGSHDNVEFQWLCKQNNIQLLFLPPHSSHVLQPLDLGCFSPLKAAYRKGISELASLDDAAPIKKQRFLTTYKAARDQALSSRIIRSGWKATGIYPFNPSKGLESSQIQQPRQCTPPAQVQTTTETTTQLLLQTPKSSQQVFKAIQAVRSRRDAREKLRTLASKAGKAIGALNAQLAAAQHRAFVQGEQIKQLSETRSRKRVTIDANTRFATIEQIKKAQEEQAIQQAKIAAKQPELEAKRAAEAVVQRSISELQFEWQS